MARSENQKLKLLYLRQMLETSSDEEHPLSASDIEAELERHGITAERKSIYSDIACLQDFGLDVELRKGRGGGYFLASRDFELPELKLLVDAVQSSKFLTKKKSMELIAKLEKQVSRYQAGSLKRDVVVSGRVKNMDESIYYSIDTIHDAIAAKSQISFRYFDWNIEHRKAYRDKSYTASPYALVWDNENYYLVAHSERYGLTNYRVDRMSTIRKTGEPILAEPARGLDLTKYGRNVFSMYHGDAVSVKMRFVNGLAGAVIDRFGQDCMMIPDGPEHFTVTEEITVSPVFLGWLTQFGTNAKVLYPQTVIDAHRALLRETLEQYG